MVCDDFFKLNLKEEDTGSQIAKQISHISFID